MNAETPESTRKRLRITLADVARKANVSSATASQVLNNRPNCWASMETRARIQEAAKTLGYRPNLAARSLREGLSRSIAKISPAFYLGTHHNRATGVFDSARKAGYAVLFSIHENRIEQENSLIQLQLDRDVDGLIVTPCDRHDHKELQRLAEIGFPLVTLDGSCALPFTCDDVSADYAAAGRLQAEHLLAIGKRRFALCNSIHPIFMHTVREDGIRQTLEKAGAPPALLLDLDVQPECELPDHAALEAGLRAALTANLGKFDALVGCDYGVSVAMRILNEIGVRVPDDVAVVGAGDSPVAQYGMVPITSVSLDDEWIGRQSFQLLVDRVARRADHQYKQLLSTPKLIVRPSSVRA